MLRLRKAKLQEGKSPQTIGSQADIKEQKQEIDDSTINSNEVIDKTLPKDSTSDELEAKETDAKIEELSMVRKESNHLMDLIISPLSEKPIKSSYEKGH